MPKIIRLGDPTDHGGKVIEISAQQFTVEDIPVARKGDKCSCPHQGHDNCVIAEGDENFKIDGIPVAFEGHKTSCGAVLQATLGNFSKS